MILVTGGTGMLGAHLIFQLLQTADSVRAIKRPTSDLRQIRRIFSYYSKNANDLIERIEWVDADMTVYEDVLNAMLGISQLYHAAAQVSFNPKIRMQLIDNNTLTTRNAVNAALVQGVKKFCHVSSIAALGSTLHGEPITEQTTKNDFEIASGYSISKFTSEAEVWRGIEDGLNAVIVNPSVILGPGNWGQGSPALISTVANGLNYYTEGVTGFVDVRDVARAMILLTESDISGEAFVLNSENLSFKTVFSIIAEQLNKHAPKKCASVPILQTAKLFERLRSLITGFEPRITEETIQSAFSKQLYSAEKIQNRLNFEFLPVAQSVRDFCRFYTNDKNIKV